MLPLALAMLRLAVAVLRLAFAVLRLGSAVLGLGSAVLRLALTYVGSDRQTMNPDGGIPFLGFAVPFESFTDPIAPLAAL